MRIVIYGTGGVGGYFGGRLAEAREDVTFIARGAHLQALREHGLTLQSRRGDVALSVQATDEPAEVGPVDAVLVCVKAWQVPEVAPLLPPLLGPDTMVVPLQNGVEAPDQLAGAVGAGHVLGGLCYVISYVAGPGHIRHVGGTARLLFGERDGTRSARAQRLRAAFGRARGVEAEIPADIRAAMWRKFMMIASASGLGALTRVPVGDWREVPETRRLFERALQEVRRLAHAHGVALEEEAVAETLRLVDGLAAASTFSMQRDVMEGRPSELATLSGAVCRLGQERGVDTPMHEMMYGCLLPQERRAAS